MALALLGAPATAIGVAGWGFASEIESGALRVDHSPDEMGLEVVAFEDGRVTLRGTGDCLEQNLCRRGLWGVEWPGGSGRVDLGAGPAPGEDTRALVRTLSEIRGAPPAPGSEARLDNFVFPGDPFESLGMAFDDVTFGPAGVEFPAWFVPGERSTWVLFVHGKGAERREALRMLPAVHALGFPALVITYRNDEAAPPGDGRYRYGATEWEDLDAAARYAVERGADGLVLVGYSMGGAIVASLLHESDLASMVRAAILDAPMLDFRATIRHGADEAGAPGPLTRIAQWIAGWRFGVDWSRLDYLARAGELSTPLLLFHGDEDDVVPVETSRALAAARPDLVTYVEVAGAHHVGSWNVDRDGYERAVAEFLGRFAP